MLEIGVLVEIGWGGNLVAFPAGKAMTRASREHVSKNTSAHIRFIKAMSVRAGKLMG